MPTSRPSPFARFYDLESKLSPSWGAHRCIQRLTTSAKRSPASRKGRENFPTLEPAVGRILGAKCLLPGAYTDRLREHVDGSEATSHLQIYFSCFKTLSPPLLFSGRFSGCSRRCFSGGSSLVLLGRVPTVFGDHQFFLWCRSRSYFDYLPFLQKTKTHRRHVCRSVSLKNYLEYLRTFVPS